MPFPTFLVLLLHGLVLWIPASSGTIIQEERKIEIETETETGNETVIGTEKENAPERESGSVITVLHQVFLTGLFSVWEFVHLCFMCREFIFGARLEDPVEVGKDSSKSSS